MAALNYIQIERRTDDIGIITLNRSEVLNANNLDVIAELSSATDTVAVGDNGKVVIITNSSQTTAQ